MNSIDEAGILALATRLQRLSERIRKQGTEIYRHCGIDFDPKWFPVIYALHKKSELGVMELAQEIGYTHPSTISLLKELTREKLVLSKKHPSDDRKRQLCLSARGKTLVEQMQPVWELLVQAITQVTDTPNNLFRAIDEVEERIEQGALLDAAHRLMKRPGTAR
ncbi:MarR family winged helix-turn-helix transcriptional regulator [Niabella beijingensis]|uniref:MarR family winged helix-turn-helix transcriptional regulator n=1 Tax=Niabella beijingensis TaxID=2872700 RepID=UPI001CBB5BCD|nr:MarR family winged helix-turn-helix transcriptional regulator [Niabella beijingensis]MBZ4187801.1 MarR family winged helix-turn-helix transcriptional regulator [Niabella beijingensis]